MAEKITKGVAKLVEFRALLSSGGTPATGKTIAITIAKNGATSFSNPAAGATNATETASGFYKFTLGAGDTDTKGPLKWRGAQADISDAGDVFTVTDWSEEADAILSRTTAAVESTMGLLTLGTLIHAAISFQTSGGNLLVRNAADSSTLHTIPLTTDGAATPITAAKGGS